MINELEGAITRDELSKSFYSLLKDEKLGTLT